LIQVTIGSIIRQSIKLDVLNLFAKYSNGIEKPTLEFLENII